MTLKTLADVRTLLRHLPEDRRARSTWRYVTQQLAQAAVGAAGPADAAIALRLALMLENVECRPIKRRGFPPPGSIEEHTEFFIVRDATGQALGYFDFEDEPGRRSADVRL